ncbi:MAG: TIM barrel protein [Candidatus Solibacter sp.]
MDRFPLGYNTYSIRALRWHDLPLIEYARSLKLDAIFLQDSIDPGIDDPAHWKAVKDAAARAGLWLGTGGPAALPNDEIDFNGCVKLLGEWIRRAAGMGSPLVRFRVAGDRDHLPPGPPAKHVEAMVKVLRAVRTLAMDMGVKLALENHKDLLCWETRQVIEGAGTEFVGAYLDTGNPVFVMEDPMQTLEILGPLALMLHLRDSVVYEARNGIAVQWVPLGEGVVDFPALLAKAKEICPPLPVFNKPITGRPPAILPVWDRAFMQKFADLRAADFARFLALAKRGGPYERHMVIEDVPGKPAEPLAAALTYQQREHMERGIEYMKHQLDLGLRWRTA